MGRVRRMKISEDRYCAARVFAFLKLRAVFLILQLVLPYKFSFKKNATCHFCPAYSQKINKGLKVKE